MSKLKDLLEISSARHQHLCPRQVLGVRMGMYAAEYLGLDLPQRDKRLYTFIETDGCALDGVSVATGCWVGRRTMQVLDFGKMAATFVDTHTKQAVRIIPHPDARKVVSRYAPRAKDHWHAYLEAYQVMPQDELLVTQPVQLIVSMKAITSREDAHALCDRCGEEIFNEREVHLENQVLCRSCAGGSYFELSPEVYIPQEVSILI
jgi:formylmethanofuran dehydrogenase subunit E